MKAPVSTSTVFLSVEQTCGRLNISGPTFYRLVNAGQINTVKFLGRRVVSQRELQRFIAAAEASGEVTL